jgi:mono/diheme cytochrome c family protein
MPSFAWKLSDAQVAAVASYVRNAWGNHASAVSPADVSSARSALSKRAE